MRDGEAAYREARARGYEGDRIVLMGESLGTGVAIALAATHEAAPLPCSTRLIHRQSTSPPCIIGCCRYVG